MAIKIALVGNPNCGKTTIFNELTGSSQYVGNWSGVTVEKKEGLLKGHKDVTIIDLPGIYSLSPYTLEEVISRDYIINEQPDVILNVVDASNIERNLYLTTQLLEIGIPVVIAMNMIDIVKKHGDIINIQELSKLFGCEIVETYALKGQGTMEVAKTALKTAETKNIKPIQEIFEQNIETALQNIMLLIQDTVSKQQLRWFSIKLFERDEKIVNKFQFDNNITKKLENIIKEETTKSMEKQSAQVLWAKEKIADNEITEAEKLLKYIFDNTQIPYIKKEAENILQKLNQL